MNLHTLLSNLKRILSPFLRQNAINYHALLAISIFVLVWFYNDEIWLRVGEFISQKGESILLKYAVFCAIFLLLWLMAELLCARIYAKFFIAFLFVIGGIAGYFIDLLHIEINADIIVALLNTDRREATDYLTPKFALHLAIFVGIPLFALYFIKLSRANLKSALLQKGVIILALIVSICALYLAHGQNIIMTFRSNSLILVANPFAPIRASVDYVISIIEMPSTYTTLGDDAQTTTKNKLFVLIIGESARAQNFAYSGYKRGTNPHTSKIDNLIYFSDFASCGVITAISVPCMLTTYRQGEYKRNLSHYSDSLLDVAKKAGYHVFWVSNNGAGCIGGVCDRLNKERVIYFNKKGQLDGDMLPRIEMLIAQHSDFATNGGGAETSRGGGESHKI